MIGEERRERVRGDSSQTWLRNCCKWCNMYVRYRSFEAKKISHYFEYNRFVFPFFEDEQMERVEKKRGE